MPLNRFSGLESLSRHEIFSALNAVWCLLRLAIFHVGGFISHQHHPVLFRQCAWRIVIISNINPFPSLTSTGTPTLKSRSIISDARKDVRSWRYGHFIEYQNPKNSQKHSGCVCYWWERRHWYIIVFCGFYGYINFTRLAFRFSWFTNLVLAF